MWGKYGGIIGECDVGEGDGTSKYPLLVSDPVHLDHVGNVWISGHGLNLLLQEELNTDEHLALVELAHFLEEQLVMQFDLPEHLHLVTCYHLLQRMHVEVVEMSVVETKSASLFHRIR